ncbi:MAG: carboxymuconolactone decarboxylase family protein [Flavobacteriaceae bacterium]
MAWIKTISYEDADPKLRRIYDRLKGPNNTIDNVLTIHSLRPHTLTGHMTLYKSVLHNSNNSLPKWYLEALGVYVSILNRCEYCVLHHFEGLKRLWKDDKRSDLFYSAAQRDTLENFFDDALVSGFHYAKKISKQPETMDQNDIEILKKSGFKEAEILEINQVCSYFNYVNRTVLGLGVTAKGDILGLSPNDSEDPSNWTHQ